MDQNNTDQQNTEQQQPQPKPKGSPKFSTIMIVIVAAVALALIFKSGNCLTCFTGETEAAASSSVPQLDEAGFEQAISNDTALVYFWATWCPPCREQGKIMEEVIPQAGQTFIGKVDTDQHKQLSQKFAIQYLPTLILFKNGQEHERLVGLQDKQTLLTAINNIQSAE